ncbi:MAG: heme utilization cystosolic carrier protein HutX [Enterobacteriaceae bacterium]
MEQNQSVTQRCLSAQLAALSTEMQGKSTLALARHFQVTEYQIVEALAAEQVSLLSGKHAQTVLQELAQWGTLTTVILAGENVFEFKGPFPTGSLGYGYYNLNAKEGFQGHLHLDSISHIALLEKPHRGRLSYSILFFNVEGACLFKIFLGRDSRHEIWPQQLVLFRQLAERFSSSHFDFTDNLTNKESAR